MKRSLMYLAVLAPMMALMPAIAAAQAPGAPVVAVLAFDNNSIGKGASDFDGIGKGVMDILITDLASNPNVRIVDRSRVQQILDEQNLTKSGAISAETAVRVGKLLGACYSIYGAFLRDLKGNNTLTAHTTSNETGQIQNPEKVQLKGDDVMKLIDQMSEKLGANLKLTGCAGTTAGTTGGAVQQSGPATAPAADHPVQFAKQLSEPEIKKFRSTRLDAHTMMIYSRALDAIDHGNKTQAIDLLSKVVAANSAFAPAGEKLAALKQSGG
jgi:TolB-like protein